MYGTGQPTCVRILIGIALICGRFECLLRAAQQYFDKPPLQRLIGYKIGWDVVVKREDRSVEDVAPCERIRLQVKNLTHWFLTINRECLSKKLTGVLLIYFSKPV